MKTLLSILSFGIGLSLCGQGLLPNPSFEENTGFPSAPGEWQLVDDWNNSGSVSATPDYFHSLGTLGGDLPETPIGEVYPAHGQAIMGFAVAGRKGENYREYLGVQLTSPLQTGVKYKLTFQLTCGKLSDMTNAGLAVSDFGAYFSVLPPVQMDNEPLMVSPNEQLEGVFFSDEWRTVNFIFTAQEAYEYLTLGCFGDDDSREIEFKTTDQASLAYYFVDEFLLKEYTAEDATTELEGNLERNLDLEPEEDDGFVDFYIPNAFTPDNDGINDLFKPASHKDLPFNMKIFNKWGELVYEMDESDQGWDGADIRRNRTNQLYVWQLNYNRQTAQNELEEVQLEGSLTVVRNP